MVGTIYAVNIGLALILFVPLFTTLDDAVGRYGIRDQLVQGFDHEWWAGFDLQAEGLDKTIRPSLSSGFGPLLDNLELLLTGRFDSFGMWILTFAAAYLLLAAFFNGGVIGLFADDKRTFSLRKFFADSAFYFHHYFALALTAVLLFLVIYKLLSGLLFSVVDNLTAQWLSQRAVWSVNLAAYLVLLAVIIFVNMIFDYAKIIIVVAKKDSSWMCIWLALKFAVAHLAKTVGLYLLLSAVAIGLVSIAGLLLSVLQQGRILLFIIALLLQQVYIFAKIGWRLCFYSSQLSMYQSRTVPVMRKMRKK